MEEKNAESDLREQIASLRRRLDHLHEDMQSKTLQTALAQEGRRVEDNLRHSIEGSLRLIRNGLLLLGGALSVIIATLGYIGLERLVPAAVDDVVAGRAEAALGELTAELTQNNQKTIALYDQALSVYDEAIERHRKAQEDHLVVLLTDYGPVSADMGTLAGSIRTLNHRARVEILTTQIDKFDAFAAAWTLRHAMGSYPEDTIFITIAGHPGNDMLSQPVVVRTKAPHFTLVGYRNGIFDWAVREFGHEMSYLVSWPAFAKAFGEDLASPRDSVPTILGPIAGLLSKGETPWSPEGTDWEDVIFGQDESHHFSPELLDYREPTFDEELEAVLGTVMEVDRFGNAITDIDESMLGNIIAPDELASITSKRIRLYADIWPRDPDKQRAGQELGKLVELILGRDYQKVEPGEPVAVLTDQLRLAINQSDFRSVYGVRQQDEVALCTTAEACEEWLNQQRNASMQLRASSHD